MLFVIVEGVSPPDPFVAAAPRLVIRSSNVGVTRFGFVKREEEKKERKMLRERK